MLQLSSISERETYYEILSVKEDASHDEIRASYKIAALSSHPDKMNLKDEQFSHKVVGHERFLKVQKAWEVLSNTNSRSCYDRELSALRQDLALGDEVRFEEMIVEKQIQDISYAYPCRCGDKFVIDSAELVEMGFSLNGSGDLYKEGAILEPASIVIPCYSCSSKIHLIIGK